MIICKCYYCFSLEIFNPNHMHIKKILIFIVILLGITVLFAVTNNKSTLNSPSTVDTLGAGDHDLTFQYDGLVRTYTIHIPTSYDNNTLSPLIIALHGGGGSSKGIMELTQLNTLSNSEGFIVIYPEGVENNWNDGRGSGETRHRAHTENINDVGFISALIDYATNTFNVDSNRVYVTGMSNGAMMSYRLACELSTKIAAVAPVTGNISQNFYPGCLPTKPISVLAINGLDDSIMPYKGGDIVGPFGNRKLGKVLSASDTIEFWAKHNGCSLSPIISQEPDIAPDDGTTIQKKEYENCKDGYEVILYTVEGGGHTWPGTSGRQYSEVTNGIKSEDIVATDIIWEFFKQHSIN